MSLRSVIVNQFKQPHGILGHVAGFIMAQRPSNRERNKWTVNLLALEPHHEILEIGCGPGLALKECTKTVTTGRVIGIDYSNVMVGQAQRRLSPEIKKGNTEVRLACLDQLTRELSGFDRVFSLNVVQFFPDLEEAFKQIYACLDINGMAATTFQPRTKNPTREQAISMALKIHAAMSNAGFTDIRDHELPLKPAPAICVTGKKH
ncbi:class I SAM-dependent methyltransferase [Hahella ganghwensis]|uniref:class I SAM-dependent methyltransferase n=1 Tax=Hahella ganghwensis TaxID=286420 RepID=UPI00037E0B1D|nr:class I SAM-dependent methyltransferase [Hahella ganghwensis]